MVTGIRALALLALGAVVAACSGGGGGSSAPSTPSAEVSRDDYAQRLAEWLCDDLAACCDGSGQSVDRAACVDVKRKAELHRLASEESHGSRVFDGAVGAECLAALDETPPSCGSERRVQRCFQTYDGMAALGEECGNKFECRGMASGDVGCVNGRCTERLAAGQQCEDVPDGPGFATCDVCRGDARCREAASDGKFYCYPYANLPRGVAGDRCTKARDVYAFPPDQSPDQSVVFAACNREDGLTCSAEGVCVPLPGVGDACELGLDCADGLNCAGGTCVPGLAAGETCKGLRTCGAGLYCQWTDVTCTERHPVTGECVSAHLNSGVCAAPSGEGEPCGGYVRCDADAFFCAPSADGGDRCVAKAESYCSDGVQKLARQASKVN
jgi:hypothetical protein